MSVTLECSECAAEAMSGFPHAEHYQPLFHIPPHLCQQISEFTVQAIHEVKKCATDLFNEMQKEVAHRDMKVIKPLTYSTCTEAEKVFNIVACIPALGILSGVIRAFAGKLQMISGVALASIGEFNLQMIKMSKKESAVKNKWETISELGKEMTIHGCLNMIRGTGEALIGTYTFGLGNLFLIIPNIVDNQNFEPRMRYGSITFTKA